MQNRSGVAQAIPDRKNQNREEAPARYCDRSMHEPPAGDLDDGSHQNDPLAV